MIHVKTADSGVSVVFGVVCNLVIPVLLGTYFIYWLVEDMFSSEGKIVTYNSQSVSIFAIENMPEELRDMNKAQDFMVVENIPHTWCA